MPIDAQIHAVLARKPDETEAQFRRRCGDFVLYSEFPGAAKDASIARTTLKGRALCAELIWGEAHGEVPLPSQTCVIASLSWQGMPGEDRLAPVPVTDAMKAQMYRAPVNPAIYPRMAQRMSWADFSKAIHLVPLVDHGRKAEVFLDGCSLGFSDYSTLREASLQVHRREVGNALHRCSIGGDPMSGAAVLPSDVALTLYPEMKIKFPREVELVVDQLAGWSSAASSAARREGWDLFQTDGLLQVQRDDDTGILQDDNEACGVVGWGDQHHHVLARTLLADQSPFEFCRVMRCARSGNEEPESNHYPRQNA